VKPPESITQSVFETDQLHLERLAALNPGECASVWDLADYMDELLYCDIQTSLLVHVLHFASDHGMNTSEMRLSNALDSPSSSIPP
jgi:hypothetical protein